MPSEEKNGKMKNDNKNEYLQHVAHYFKLSNPLHLVANEKRLNNAKAIINPGNDKEQQKKNKQLSESEKENAKYLYESAYYPNGEKRPFVTRLVAQLPLKMITLGGMLSYYELTPHIIFWQWLHQTLISYIDYENRNAPGNSIPASEVGCAYSASTVGAVATALAINNVCKCKPLLRRFGPLAAVSVGSLINTAILKHRNWTEGVTVSNCSETPVGISKVAGSQALMQAVMVKVLLTAPALVLTPMILHNLEQKNKFCLKPWLEKAYSFGVTGLLLYFLTPFVLASFCKRGAVKTEVLEDEIKKQKAAKNQDFLYYDRDLD